MRDRESPTVRFTSPELLSNEILLNVEDLLDVVLTGSLPPLEGVRRRLVPVEGNVPEPWNLPPGCSFAPRCPRRVEACGMQVPSLASKAADRR